MTETYTGVTTMAGETVTRVADTAGGAVNHVTATTGDVVNSAKCTVGSTVDGVKVRISVFDTSVCHKPFCIVFSKSKEFVSFAGTVGR